jgi:hypothetical protein
VRFSLKTFLLTTTLFGAGCGLFVHFKNNNPEGLFGFLQILSTVVPFVLALSTVLWVAVKGSPPKNRKLIRWAATLIILPIAILGFLGFASDSGGAYAFVANSYLVSPKFAGQIDNVQVWMEMERRVNRGQLNDAEVTTAIDSLIGGMESATNNKSATWAPGQPLHWADRFLATLPVQHLARPTTLIRLLDTYNGIPTVTATILPANTDQKGQVAVNVKFGNPFGQSMPRNVQWTANFFVDGQRRLPIAGRLVASPHFCEAIFPIEKQGEHEIRVDVVRTYPSLNSGNGGFTTSPVKSWNVSKDYPLRTIPVTVKVNVGE